MNTPEKNYFSFMIPAMLMMIAGMLLPIMKNETRSELLLNGINNIRIYLKGKSNIGIVFMIVGLSTGLFSPFLPFELRYVAYLFSKLLFVGIFYVLFSDLKNKNYYLWGGVGALILQTIVQGMFGELVYTCILGLILLLLGKNISLSRKYTLAVLGAFFIFKVACMS
jgi:hypothetical protein